MHYKVSSLFNKFTKLLLPAVDIDSLCSSTDAFSDASETVVREKVSRLKHQSTILATAVRSVLPIEHDIEFLSDVYIPFLSYFLVFSDPRPSPSSQFPFIRTLEELDVLFMGSECRLSTGSHQYYLPSFPAYDSNFTLCTSSLNIYETIAFKIFSITCSSFESYSSDNSPTVSIDYASRLMLKQYLESQKLFIPFIERLIPYSLFENLLSVPSAMRNSFSGCHWLGPIFTENYLFFLASLKKSSRIVIGQPHGGLYAQHKSTHYYELAERALSDIYLSPSWSLEKAAFPNWRASRNTFLAQKFRFKPRRRLKRFLVILPYYYLLSEPSLVSPYYNQMTFNEFTLARLMTLSEHFDGPFDFKIYPRQESLPAEVLRLVSHHFPDSNFISGTSVIRLAHSYEAVIHLDTNGTSIVELSTSAIPQYVYLGPELNLLDSYRDFIWKTRLNSTRDTFASGCYVLIDNHCYRNAYRASYRYPFYFISLFKSCQKRIRMRDAHQFFPRAY